MHLTDRVMLDDHAFCCLVIDRSRVWIIELCAVGHLREDARMSVEEVLVEYRVVVGERLGEPGQPRGRYLLERRLVRLVTDTTHVDDYAVLSVRVHLSHVTDVSGISPRAKSAIDIDQHVTGRSATDHGLF